MGHQGTEELIARLARDAEASSGEPLLRRRLGARVAVFGALGGLVAGLLVLALLGARSGLGSAIMQPGVALKFVAGLGLAVAGFALAGRLARPGARPAIPFIAWLALGLVALATAATLLLETRPAPLHASALACSAAVFALALVPLAAAFAALRAGAPTRPGIAGAAAGAAAAGLAGAAYALFCPLERVLDVVVAYGLGYAAAAALGAVAGARVLRW